MTSKQKKTKQVRWADKVEEIMVKMEDKREGRRMKQKHVRRADGAHRPTDEEWRGAPEE